MGFFRQFLLAILYISTMSSVFGQTRTISGSGNWSDSGNWIGGNIGGDVDNDDDVVMNDAVDITIQDMESYTVATLSASKEGSLTIDEGGTLTVTGDVLIDKEFTINVSGDLIINGNLDIAKNLILNVTSTGTVTVLGNVTIAKEAGLHVDGAVEIYGSLTLDKDSSLTGMGTVGVAQGCTTNGTPDLCGDSQIDSSLPVELLFFQTESDGSKVMLNWATATEENFDYFSVQRSKNLSQFNEIGRVQGNGDSQNRIDYQFEDNDPYDGTSYYRLQSIDFDGYTEIFNAVSVFVKASSNFEVYPSILRGSTLNVKFESINDRTLNLLVLDLAGRKKFESQLEIGGTVEIPRGLENGVYFIELWDQDIVNRSRIIISR